MTYCGCAVNKANVGVWLEMKGYGEVTFFFRLDSPGRTLGQVCIDAESKRPKSTIRDTLGEANSRCVRQHMEKFRNGDFLTVFDQLLLVSPMLTRDKR